MADWNFVVSLSLTLLNICSAHMTDRYVVDNSFVNKTCSLGSILHSLGPMSRTKCAVRCQSHNSCIGMVYKTSEELCVLCSTTPTEVTTGTEFFGRRGRWGDPCVVGQFECKEANQNCVEGMCACFPGHSYNYTTHSCVTACTTYGPTFQKHPYSVIGGNDVPLQLNDGDVGTCIQTCIDLVMVCKSFDFNFGNSRCSINTGNAFDLASAYSAHNSFHYYDRNCLEL